MTSFTTNNADSFKQVSSFSGWTTFCKKCLLFLLLGNRSCDLHVQLIAKNQPLPQTIDYFIRMVAQTSLTTYYIQDDTASFSTRSLYLLGHTGMVSGTSYFRHDQFFICHQRRAFGRRSRESSLFEEPHESTRSDYRTMVHRYITDIRY